MACLVVREMRRHPGQHVDEARQEAPMHTAAAMASGPVALFAATLLLTSSL
jgi:hypothetical protein